MIGRLTNLVKENAKAIVAFIATFLAGHFGLDIPADVQLAVASLIVAVLTWLFPNKRPEEL